MFRITLLSILFLFLGGCSKQPPPDDFKPHAKGNQFIIRVIGVDYFSCTCDTVAREASFTVDEENQ